MPPTSKKLEGHIASGASIHPSIHLSCFSMHSITRILHVTVLKFLIWIPQEKQLIHIFFFFFSTGLCPFPELWPFEKIWMQSCQQNISKTIEAKTLKLDEWTGSDSWPRWLSWMRRPTGDQEVAGSTPAEVGNILSWRLIMKYFLRSFSPFR